MFKYLRFKLKMFRVKRLVKKAEQSTYFYFVCPTLAHVFDREYCDYSTSDIVNRFSELYKPEKFSGNGAFLSYSDYWNDGLTKRQRRLKFVNKFEKHLFETGEYKKYVENQGK